MTSRYKRRERDFARMGWVKLQMCAVAEECGTFVGCMGDRVAHHAGVHALSRKADDDTCVALCRAHHVQLHERRGYFEGWDRPRMRAWQDALIAVMQRRYADE